jgi:Importin-beta N-terminal domain
MVSLAAQSERSQSSDECRRASASVRGDLVSARRNASLQYVFIFRLFVGECISIRAFLPFFVVVFLIVRLLDFSRLQSCLQAEAKLKEAQRIPGHSIKILNILESLDGRIDPAVRQAAAVHFKNLVN